MLTNMWGMQAHMYQSCLELLVQLPEIVSPVTIKPQLRITNIRNLLICL